MIYFTPVWSRFLAKFSLFLLHLEKKCLTLLYMLCKDSNLSICNYNIFSVKIILFSYEINQYYYFKCWGYKSDFSVFLPKILFLWYGYILLYRARHKFSKPAFFSYAALALEDWRNWQCKEVILMEPFILAFAISWIFIFSYLLSLLKKHAEFNKRLM